MSTGERRQRRNTHKLGPESPVALAGDVTRGCKREDGESYEGRDDEDGEE